MSSDQSDITCASCAHTLSEVRGSESMSGDSPAVPPSVLPAVLVPVKRFDKAKLRLAEKLTDSQRRSLAKAMAETVIAAARPLPVFVVCEDGETQRWATDLGVGVMRINVKGLNPSITAAVSRLRDVEPDPYTHALIAHGDLVRAKSLEGLIAPSGVLIVPDRHLDGTNVMSVPLRADSSRRGDLPRRGDFQFHYGVGSFQAHLAEARRLGVEVTVLRKPELELDVDTVDDLGEIPPGEMPRGARDS